ncbi:MAG TPA: gliding motility protein GldM [Chitinophagales bacterium]|nr:gliding motility protein GldM [Chitinophagales bacterium]
MNNAKMTPRQKMINMLYLVLTAILALNVSSEVLDAFKNVNDGISISNSSLQTKTASLYSQMDFQYQNDPVKAKYAYENSKRAHEVSSKLYNLLEQYKKEIIAEAGGIDAETGKIKRDDDVNVATLMFIEDGGKKGKELKAQIEATRAQLLTLVPEQERAGVEKSLSLKVDDPGAGNTWEYAKFNHVPVVAAVTLLNKYQNDLLGAENHVVETLYKSINDGRIVVDQMEAKIISPSNLIMQGEAYKADVMVAAYSSTQHPDVFLGAFNSQIKKGDNGTYQMIESASDMPPLLNAKQVDVDGGFGKLAMDGSTTGVKKYTGVVRVKKDNRYQFYPFEGEYQVAPKLAVVSPKMMNVLYIGLENPVDVSVAGVAQADVIATVEGNGTLVKNGNSYNMLVTAPGTTKVKISAKVNGKVMPMGEQVFRVKSIPSPATSVDGVAFGGSTTGSFIEKRSGIVPKLDDFIYGQIPWKVQTFTVSVLKGGQVFKVDNVGPVFNAKTKELMKGLKKGDGFFVDDIMVKGPDNKVRRIAPIGFNITAQ